MIIDYVFTPSCENYLMQIGHVEDAKNVSGGCYTPYYMHF